MQQYFVGKNEAGQHFDKFLNKYLPVAGSAFIYKMLRKKNITLNKKKATGNEILSLGDCVETFFSQETYDKFRNIPSNPREENDSEISSYLKAYEKWMNLKILYEDEDIILVDKPAGLLTQKAKESDISLNDWLIGYLLSKQQISRTEFHTFHPSVVNRIDRNTSGLVVCGKSLTGLQQMSELFRGHNLDKRYLTICKGSISSDFVAKGFLEKNEKTNCVKIMENGTKENAIHTGFHPICSSNDFTLLEVVLFTGKPHQIRAHLASMGHPIIGDGKYGDCKVNEKVRNEFGLKNQLLHSYYLDIPQGIFKAPAPKQFKTISSSLLHFDLE